MYFFGLINLTDTLYAAAQASIMRMRGGRGASGGARTARQGARWEGAVGARRAVRAQKIGARRARCVRKKYFFSFEFVQVRAFAGARGENIFLVEAFSRAFWRTDGGRRTEDGRCFRSLDRRESSSLASFS